MATINGTNASDNLNGTSLADQIFGLGGNDILIGFDSDDLLEGGAGADQLFGSSGLRHRELPRLARRRHGEPPPIVRPAAVDAVGDALFSVEGLRGSAFADSLAGDDQRNILYGEDGTDEPRVAAAATTARRRRR